MRYFGTHFNLTLAGLRLRVRVDLDDARDEPEDVRCDEGSRPNGDVRYANIPHHLRSWRT
jgi:hypothetical protein